MTFTHVVYLDRPLLCYLKLGQGEVQEGLADVIIIHSQLTNQIY